MQIADVDVLNPEPVEVVSMQLDGDDDLLAGLALHLLALEEQVVEVHVVQLVVQLHFYLLAFGVVEGRGQPVLQHLLVVDFSEPNDLNAAAEDR